MGVGSGLAGGGLEWGGVGLGPIEELEEFPVTGDIDAGDGVGLAADSADEMVEVEIGAKAEVAGEGGEAAFDAAGEAFGGGEVVDYDDGGSGAADAEHFADHGGGVGDDRGDVHGDGSVEGIVGKVEVLGIHLEERFNLGGIALGESPAGGFQHFGANIDTGDLNVWFVVAECAAGADADFEDLVLWILGQGLDGTPTSLFDDTAKNEVVDGGIKFVGILYAG